MRLRFSGLAEQAELVALVARVLEEKSLELVGTLVEVDQDSLGLAEVLEPAVGAENLAADLNLDGLRPASEGELYLGLLVLAEPDLVEQVVARSALVVLRLDLDFLVLQDAEADLLPVDRELRLYLETHLIFLEE